MSFGLEFVLTSYQKSTDNRLASARWQDVSVYLGDVVDISMNAKEHLRHDKSILLLIQMTEMSLKLKIVFSLSTQSTIMAV